ncbi:MAG TPA: tetratricopeptide repeat protein [Thermoanaerobaculia bacterium]|nr:tetratricopeptide repeat protein [Thermoanaerobaculia bacterium]
MRRVALLLFPILLATPVFAASARVGFERVLPAVHDLGPARDLALVHTPGNSDATETFVEFFIDRVNQAGFLHARDARESTGPADAYLTVHSFTCETFNREGEGTARDQDGSRVKRRHVWVDAVCVARVDVRTRDMKQVSSFFGRGDGTSPRVETLSDEETYAALRLAARYAGSNAAERITPRRIREHIQLDESAPAFEEGFGFIESGRIAEARATWEAELRRNPRSAPLHFNLAAVCEALGDRKAARKYYATAAELAPEEHRYTNEMRSFARRQ